MAKQEKDQGLTWLDIAAILAIAVLLAISITT
jgi:hypothetical protein